MLLFKALNDASKGALKLPSRVTSVWCIEEATEGAHTQGSTGDRDREARDVWECCLALVVYYLTDIGVLKCDMQQGTCVSHTDTHLHPARTLKLQAQGSSCRTMAKGHGQGPVSMAGPRTQ